MLRSTFFLLTALFVVSACGPNCNTPYGGYTAGVYQQPGCPVYPSQYPTTQYPNTQYPTNQYPYAGYPQRSRTRMLRRRPRTSRLTKRRTLVTAPRVTRTATTRKSKFLQSCVIR